MGKASKRLKRDPSESEEEFGSHDSDMDTAAAMGVDSEEEFDSEDDPSASGDDNNEKSEVEEEDEDDESDQEQNRDAEMEQLEKEYLNLRNEEQNLLTNLKRHKDEDVLKGQAVKNQKEFDSEDDPSASGDDNNEKSEVEEEDEDDESDQEQNRDAEMEQLEKEYLNLRNEEQNLLTNLKRHKDEDVLKGQAVKNQKEFDSEDDPSASGDDNNEKSEVEEEDEDDESDQEQNRDAEMEQLEKEYLNLRNEEQNLLTNLKRHKDEDVLKGQAVKNQKALWDRTLELRFLLQKAFSSSNKLPKDPVRSEFCSSNEAVDKAYADIISSSQGVLSSMLDLQEALLEKNPSIVQTSDGNNKESGKHDVISNGLNEERDDDWLRLQHMHLRLAPFRNNAVDKWQRKTLVNTGAAVLKGKLHAFNQNISDQVAGYMRDPSRMIKRMQLRRPSVGIIGEELVQLDAKKEDDNVNEDGDPELLDDSEFYQQLLKEFLESCNLGSSESMFYAMRRMQPKKRKVVDRRASKSRKLRYHVHEKIVNFMAPLPMTVPPMAPKLFENLFGLGNQ